MRELTDKEMQEILRDLKIENGLDNRKVEVIVLLLFSRKDLENDAYFNKINGYLTSSAVQTRLKIDPIKFATFQGLLGGPRLPTATPPNTNGTEHTWNYVYPLEKQKATFTHPLKTEKDTLLGKIKAAIVDMYGDIPDNAINKTDTKTLGIKKKSDRKKRTNSPEEIKGSVTIKLIPLGGGKVWVICTTGVSSNRPSKLNKMVNIELAFSLIPINATPPVPQPATSKKCDTFLVVSTAKFLLNLGEEAPGFRLVLFARWVYTKHPAKSGSFGSSKSCVVC
jgi:hypothetical protein